MKNYLSYAEANELCDEMVTQFMEKETQQPKCVNIEGFVKEYLGCAVVYEKFAESDTQKIGFASDGETPLNVLRNGRAKAVVFPRNTVVLDTDLKKPAESERRRFTLGHEAGHILMTRIDPDQRARFYRAYSKGAVYSVEDLKEMYSIAEWQANTMASALLMPRFLISDNLKRYNRGKNLPVFGDSVFRPREKEILNRMADSLGVSYTALVIRLRQLGHLSHRSIAEYIQAMGIRGEVA